MYIYMIMESKETISGTLLHSTQGFGTPLHLKLQLFQDPARLWLKVRCLVLGPCGSGLRLGCVGRLEKGLGCFGSKGIFGRTQVGPTVPDTQVTMNAFVGPTKE